LNKKWQGSHRAMRRCIKEALKWAGSGL